MASHQFYFFNNFIFQQETAVRWLLCWRR